MRCCFVIALLLTTATRAAPPAVCSEVLKLANDGKLSGVFQEKMRDPPDSYPNDPNATEEPVFLGRVDVPGAIGERYLYSVNGDPRIYDQDMDKRFLDRVPTSALGNHSLRGPASGVIRRDGRDYIVYASGNELSYVSRIDAGPVEKLMCRFDKAGPPRTVARDGQSSVCQAVIDGKVKYTKFNQPHALLMNKIDDRRRAYLLDIPPGAARVDIDNDGTQESIARLVYFHSSANSGSLLLARLNPERDGIDDGPLQSFLDNLRIDFGGEWRIFEFGGLNYLEVPPTREWKEIRLVKDGKVIDVCDIDLRVKSVLLPN